MSSKEQLILPQEVWLRSFLWLNANSLRQMAGTTTYFRQAIREDDGLSSRCFTPFPPLTWKERFSFATAKCLQSGAYKKILKLYDRNYRCPLVTKEWNVIRGYSEEEFRQKIELLLSESQSAIVQRHRNLVECFGAFCDYDDSSLLLPEDNPPDVKFYLFTEYLAHGSVEDLVDTHGPLKEDQIRVFLQDCLRALVYLEEQGHTYEKIYPSNMMLAQEDETGQFRIKLAPRFTIAEVDKMEKASLSNLAYIKPESLDDTSESYKYPFRGAVWTLAMSVLNMATAKHPWEGVVNIDGNSQMAILYSIHAKDPVIPKHLSAELRDILREKMLQKSPHCRSTAKELLELSYFSSSSTVVNCFETNEEYYRRVSDWRATKK